MESWLRSQLLLLVKRNLVIELLQQQMGVVKNTSSLLEVLILHIISDCFSWLFLFFGISSSVN